MLRNLRSVIIAQVTRGGRSAVPGRNISSSNRRRNLSSSNVSKRAGERVIALEELVPSLEWMGYGLTASFVFEIVQLAEYHRTVMRDVRKRGLVRADDDPLRKGLNSLFDALNGERK